MAVAFKACLDLYYAKHPTHQYMGMRPSLGFIEGYIGAFLERELWTRDFENHENKDDAKLKEILEHLRRANKEIEQLLNLRNIQL